ncbi:hypothetical protein I79_025051 [Cricetulus griseus]|uniref:Uncharacterized protein n=1 Tax=Cricetulus griseus TaxID=10029 RepID=G3IMB4_CRIGR|nr:hypothetical protein I79_025051 [Cricetulus griseus]
MPILGWLGLASSTDKLQVQRKVLAGDLELQGQILLFLLHRGRKDESNLVDEEQGLLGEPV